MKILLIFALFLVITPPSFAAVTHDELRSVISAFKKGMSPWMKENREAKLSVLDQWSSDDLTGGGAGARGNGSEWNDIRIHITGAFAKNPVTTENTVAFALCHELGHLAAQNKKRSGEQLADQFAITVCLPIVYENLQLNTSNSPSNDEVLLCGKSFGSRSEIESCARLLKASMDTAVYRYDYWVNHNMKCSKPAYLGSATTSNDSPQCSLDIAMSLLLKRSEPICLDYKR